MTCDVSNNRLFDTTDGDHEKSAVKPKVPAGITKTFRSYDQDQMFLLPPSLDEWLPDDHSARFISEVVEELLDLEGSTRVLGESASPFKGRVNRLPCWTPLAFHILTNDTQRCSASSADIVGAGPEVIAPQVFLHLDRMRLAQPPRRHPLERVD